MKQKVKAFTILEVTVAMLLAAISMAIAYTAYTIMHKSYVRYNEKNKKIAELVLMDKLLKKDCMNAKNMVCSAYGISLTLDSGEITYEFRDIYVLRNQFALHTDTFFVANAHPEFIFEGASVNPGERIDQLWLPVIQDGKNIRLIYDKQYSSENLFQ